MMKAKSKSLSLEKKQSRTGYLFVSPVVLGLITIFLPVLVQSLIFSFSDISISMKGFETKLIGFEHYYKALFIDPTYRRVVVDSISRMAVEVPIIIIFSFFMANVLNQKFRGSTFTKVLFLLPVIISTGIISASDSSNMLYGMYSSGGKLAIGSIGTDVFNFKNLEQWLMNSSINSNFVNIILGAINGIYGIVTNSGVQLLIFLAGLKSIPLSMFEAAKVEGATQWEIFWKISFPYISPLMLVNIIYTVIDTFMSYRNGVVMYIKTIMAKPELYAFSSSLSWVYVLVIGVFLGILWFIMKRMIVYQD